MNTWTTDAESVDGILSDIWDTRDLVSLLAKMDANPNEYEPAEIDRAKTLAAEVEPYAQDYQYGAAVIDAGYWVQYAQDLADDIGAVDKDAGWPCSYIDWDAAADALAIDYTLVSFEGHEFYIR